MWMSALSVVIRCRFTKTTGFNVAGLETSAHPDDSG